jgi:hypothetical protein
MKGQEDKQKNLIERLTKLLESPLDSYNEAILRNAPTISEEFERQRLAEEGINHRRREVISFLNGFYQETSDRVREVLQISKEPYLVLCDNLAADTWDWFGYHRFDFVMNEGIYAMGHEKKDLVHIGQGIFTIPSLQTFGEIDLGKVFFSTGRIERLKELVYEHSSMRIEWALDKASKGYLRREYEAHRLEM